jgi:hypothetical protein
MYCDVSLIRNELFGPNIADICDFKVVNEMQYSIPNPFDCLFEFLPVTFENQYFCIANTSIHCMLLEFPFRMGEVKNSGEELHSILA